MTAHKQAESVTENLFRGFYGTEAFIEKSAIGRQYGFISKAGTDYSGKPDFFRDEASEPYVFVVEAKALKHKDAENEVKFYLSNNKIYKPMIGVAVSGQTLRDLKVSYYLKKVDEPTPLELNLDNKLLSVENLIEAANRFQSREIITTDDLVNTIKYLNERFQQGNIRDANRSLLFAGLLIALTDNSFRSTYLSIQPPKRPSTSTSAILESSKLNSAIVDAIESQIGDKINSLSKEYGWKHVFGFIEYIDYPLLEFQQIIKLVEDRVYAPFMRDEKQDILGRAYKIFLSRAGKIDNKNIIITPDHIKSLMVKLARLDVDDVVIDTCTGTGGFLMEAMETLVGLANQNDATIKRIREEQLIGFEIDSTLFALACSNLFLHGDGRTNLIYRSSLLDGSGGSIINSRDIDVYNFVRSMRPNKCIINPPYENDNPIKFTRQAIDYLQKDGRLIIIMPTPTLKKHEDGLTTDLLKEARLDFVIKMPEGLFREQNRTVSTSIFGFTKRQHRPDDEVLFFSLADDGYVSVQHKGRVDKFGLWQGIETELLKSINQSRELPGKCVKRKIFRNGVLNVYGVRETSDETEMVRLSDLFTIERGSLASEDAIIGSELSYPFVTASEEWKQHSSYTHDGEAIIYAVAASGSLGRAHYIKEKFTASNLCLILTKNPEFQKPVSLEFYAYYLDSIRKQIRSDLADGTSKLTIRQADLESYYIDYFDYDYQTAFVKNYLGPIRAAKEELKRRIKAANKALHIAS